LPTSLEITSGGWMEASIEMTIGEIILNNTAGGKKEMKQVTVIER
jgi:hypothetical protein